MKKNILIVFVKEPIVGKVKTRLGKDIGMDKALEFYIEISNMIIDRLSISNSYEVFLAVTPDELASNKDIFPQIPIQRRIKQGEGNLGQRKRNIINNIINYTLQQYSDTSFIFIGTDIPDIEVSHIEKGFDILSSFDGVIGPSSDGGYWSLGYRNANLTENIDFKSIRYSSEHTMNDLLNASSWIDYKRLPVLDDIDNIREYEKYLRDKMS